MYQYEATLVVRRPVLGGFYWFERSGAPYRRAVAVPEAQWKPWIVGGGPASAWGQPLMGEAPPEPSPPSGAAKLPWWLLLLGLLLLV